MPRQHSHLDMEHAMFIYHTELARVNANEKYPHDPDKAFKAFESWCYNHWTLVFIPQPIEKWQSFYLWNRAGRPIRDKDGKIHFTSGPLKRDQDKGFPGLNKFLDTWAKHKKQQQEWGL